MLTSGRSALAAGASSGEELQPEMPNITTEVNSTKARVFDFDIAEQLGFFTAQSVHHLRDSFQTLAKGVHSHSKSR
ncbi:MAG: hypothetical protein EA428_12125 [Spirochaetaceae bacterium]|nr:MAG: hypothetical protein EA428_12125 [Spirochaetaceae bacterium]